MDTEDKDPILDSLLEEVLAGRAPPDMTARILQASAARRYGNSITGQEIDGNHEPAAPPILPGIRPALHQASMSGSVSPTPQSSANGKPRHSRSFSAAITIAAAAAVIGLGLTIGLISLFRSGPRQLAHDVGRSAPKTVPTPQNIATGSSVPEPVRKPAAVERPPVAQSPQIVQSEPIEPVVIPQPEATAPQPPASRAETTVAAAPRSRKVDRSTPTPDAQVVSFVNSEFGRVWKDAGIKPTPQVSDAEWCERLFTRVLGRAPTAEELKNLASDKAASRREKLVERLLTQSNYAEEYADHWAAVLTHAFIGNGGRGNLARRDELEKYFAAALRQGKAYDVIATELLTASGSTKEGAEDYNPAVNFLLEGMDRTVVAPTARVSRVMLGHQLQCAQCHDHPTQDWKQEQFWALNAALHKLRVDRQGEVVRLVAAGKGGREGSEVAFETPAGVAKTAGPGFLDGTKILANDGVDPRPELASLVVESRDFAKAAVNRIWSQLFDYGFTRPVDGLGPHSATVAPAALDRLAIEFAAHDFDLRRVLHWAVLSDPFGRSSKVTDLASKDMPEEGEVALFSRFYRRPPQGAAVLGALVQADRIRTAGGSRSELEKARVDWLMQGNRTPTKAGKNSAPSAGSAVMVPAGDVQHKSVSGDPTGLVKKLAASKMPFEKQVEHLFLAAVARAPSQREQQAAQQLVRSSRGSQSAALEDIWWALQNSNECVLDR